MMGGLHNSYKHTRVPLPWGAPWESLGEFDMVRHQDRLPSLATHYNVFLQVQPHNFSLGVNRYMTDNCPHLWGHLQPTLVLRHSD